MCRHLAYLGPPRPLAELVLHRPHSLVRQAWAPVDMRGGGTLNADGFGLGWYPGHGPSGGEPVRYRRTGPIWSDTGLPDLAASISSSAVVAAVRSATPGMPVHEGACAPFLADGWLFSHNGVVTGWPGSVAGLAEELAMHEVLRMEALTDAALLWALLRRRLAAGGDPGDALGGLVCDVLRVAPGSRLNLLLTDGRAVHATTCGHALSVLDTGDALVVASEPWDDDPRWASVPDHTLLSAVPGDVRPRSTKGEACPPT